MFENRKAAGKLLAHKLSSFKNKKDTVVVGITRGGVVLAKEISQGLDIPMDIIVIKKIGVPHNPELAIGAVGPRETIYWDEALRKRLGNLSLEKRNLLRAKNKERRELENLLRAKKDGLSLKGKTVILVDDGVATGATVLCARKFLEEEKAKAVVLATPVIEKDTFNSLKQYFNRVILLEIPEEFYAIGQFYEEFGQISNEEVRRLLTNSL